MTLSRKPGCVVWAEKQDWAGSGCLHPDFSIPDPTSVTSLIVVALELSQAAGCRQAG